MAAKDPSLSVPHWLKALPVAPEYHPTLAEFHDPISYIYKIEKEASQYGICKIVPPLSQAPKNTAITNFNRSVAARSPFSDSKAPPTFTTVQQQIGVCSERSRPAEKLVWQSGENYTLKDFKEKSKQFENAQLKKTGKKVLSQLEIETLYWRACGGEPFSVECADAIPGSAFVPINEKKLREAGEATMVGETAWNMRGVSRANGSLLRFMKEEIPGVNSPLIYLAMLYGWSGWHVEDHDLHSLNYIHMGAAKTWYGVPKEGAAAFEEVVRVRGYGGEVNPLVTCAVLVEKTTIMSPEVLIDAGVPCCRLVQNAGEFVVTFPRAYHCGFSHGFSCGETANIATPEWLMIAKEAAIRRASINCPPLVSHFQLLYALALSLYSRIPLRISTEPRSSRLKEKKRGEGETILKELFVQLVVQNNELLHVLLEKGNCVLLPQDSSNIICSNISMGSKVKVNPRFSAGISSPGEESEIQDTTSERERSSRSMGILGDGTFPCVTCGILCFGCAAVIQPRETSAKYFESADCSFFNDRIVGSRAPDEYSDANWSVNTPDPNSLSGKVDKSNCDEGKKCISALDLLASVYGHASDSEDENIEHETPMNADENHIVSNQSDRSGSGQEIFTSAMCDQTIFRSLDSGHFDEEAKSIFRSSSSVGGNSKVASLVCSCPSACHRNHTINDVNGRCKHNAEKLLQSEMGNKVHRESPCGPADCSMKSTTMNIMPNCSPATFGALTSRSNLGTSIKDAHFSSKQRAVEDSFREHIFCLEHAVEVEEQLQPIGGVHVLLICHPDYPGVETEAKVLAKELRIKYLWKDLSFREATKDDLAKIQSSVEAKKAVPSNADWTVKLGINISYSASFGQDSLNNNQMPNNAILRNTFGYSSPTNSAMKPKVSRRKRTGHNKVVVAGKWCGKAWMSNLVHPYLAQRENQKNETLVSFNLQATPQPKVKHESTPELSDQSELQPLLTKQKVLQSVTTTDSGNSERKRKGTHKRGTTKKPKYAQPDNPVEAVEDAPVPSLPPHSCGMVLRSRRTKRKTSPVCCRVKKEDSASDSDTCRRKRSSKLWKEVDDNDKPVSRKQTRKKVVKTSLNCKKFTSVKDEEVEQYQCDMDGCRMEFGSKQDLALHKRNICLVEGCGKKFFSHEYLSKHERVHTDDRPLKCPWKGCKMAFKWAWARTEHIRVHTGARPYECQEPGCGQTFRFITDFSRHRRKTGHSVRKKGGN